MLIKNYFMRYILCLVIVLFACNNTGQNLGKNAATNSTGLKIASQSEVTTTDALSQQILYSLKNNSYNEFDRLLVGQDSFLDYMRKTNEFDESQANNQELVKTAYTLFKSLALSNFERNDNLLKQSGFDWNNVEVVSSNFNEATDVYKMVFKDGNKQFSFTSEECAKVNGKFYLGNINSLKKN